MKRTKVQRKLHIYKITYISITLQLLSIKFIEGAVDVLYFPLQSPGLGDKRI